MQVLLARYPAIPDTGGDTIVKYLDSRGTPISEVKRLDTGMGILYVKAVLIVPLCAFRFAFEENTGLREVRWA